MTDAQCWDMTITCYHSVVLIVAVIVLIIVTVTLFILVRKLNRIERELASVDYIGRRAALKAGML